MAGGATGEGEALDYASTVVHALAPHAWLESSPNILWQLSGSQQHCSEGRRAGRTPEHSIHRWWGPRPWVVCGRSAGSHDEVRANLVQAFRNLARQFGITSECWRSNPGPSSGSGHNHNPWRCFAWSGYGCSNSRGKQDGRGEWFGARWVEHCTEHNQLVEAPRRAPRAAQQNRHLHHLHQWYSRGTPHKLNQFHNPSTIRTFSKYPRLAQSTWGHYLRCMKTSHNSWVAFPTNPQAVSKY